MKSISSQNRFLKIFIFSLTWASAALFLYSYCFQIPSTLSLSRMAYSIGLGGLPAACFLWLDSTQPDLLQRLTRSAVARSFFITLGLCLILWIFQTPDFTLFAPRAEIKIEVKAQKAQQKSVKIIWINNGLADVPSADVKLSPGSSFDDSGISLALDPTGAASLEWKGRAWRQVKVVFSSPPDMTVTVQSSPGGMNVYPVESAGFPEKPIQIPVFGEGYYLLLTLVLRLTTFISLFSVITLAGWLPLGRPLARLEEKIKIFPNPEVVGIWTGAVFTLIAAFIILIAFNNRFYADDYCYTVKLRQYGFFGAIVDSFQTLNGRLMSHFVDYLALLLGKWSVPLGPILFLLGVGGSLCFLFAQLLVGQDRKVRYAMAALISLVILMLTFLLAPDLYESIFWTLHALILTGGLSAFNIALGLLVRYMPEKISPNRRVGISLLFLGLGFIGSFFNEAITIFTIALFGIILAGVILRWRVFLKINLPVQPVVSFLIGAVAALFIIIFSPGNTRRFSALGLSLNLANKFSGFMTLVRNNLTVIFLENHPSGLFILACTLLVGYACGRLMLQSLKFSEQRLNHFEKFMVWLALFILPLLIFLPSTFLSSYFPKRTLYIPLYFILIIYFILAMYMGSRAKSSAVGQKSLSILLVAAVLVFGVTSFIRLDSTYRQMRLFSTEWDARETAIQQAAVSGQKDIVVQHFKDTFGTDLSTDSNSFLYQCMNDYYGLNFHVEETK
jgi:hypothetical protein